MLCKHDLKRNIASQAIVMRIGAFITAALREVFALYPEPVYRQESFCIRLLVRSASARYGESITIAGREPAVYQWS